MIFCCIFLPYLSILKTSLRFKIVANKTQVVILTVLRNINEQYHG